MIGFERNEYIQLFQQFSEFQHLKPLLKSIKLVEGTDQNVECIEVEWLENINEKVYVCLDGWYVRNSEDRFPTFESLAMRRSAQFNQKWGEALHLKLQELEQEEEEEW